MFYEMLPSVFFLAVFTVLFLASLLGHRIGRRMRGQVTETSPLHLPDAVPGAIHTVLALILGFTFSLAVERFEQRRQLVIDEANQIGSTFQQTQALLHGREEMATNLRRYIDARIVYYDAPRGSPQSQLIEERTREIEGKLFDTAYRITKTERTAIENGVLLMLNEMSDLRNARNFALLKTMPKEIYWVLLILSAMGALAAGYVRGQKGQQGQWQPAILVAMVAILFFMILDIDQPTMGGIQISQDAMYTVRDQMNASASPRVSPGGAAGKAPSWE